MQILTSESLTTANNLCFGHLNLVLIAKYSKVLFVCSFKATRMSALMNIVTPETGVLTDMPKYSSAISTAMSREQLK